MSVNNDANAPPHPGECSCLAKTKDRHMLRDRLTNGRTRSSAGLRVTHDSEHAGYRYVTISRADGPLRHSDVFRISSIAELHKLTDAFITVRVPVVADAELVRPRCVRLADACVLGFVVLVSLATVLAALRL